MIEIRFNPAELKDATHQKWWEDFRKRSDAARDAVLSKWEEWMEARLADPAIDKFRYKFTEGIWKDLKRWLFEHVFQRKCAYCESTLELDRYLGDAEHYRPKGNVTNKKNRATRVRVVVKLDNGEDIDHPGYFWLAYDWRNLMPACSDCNSGAAKVDQFPAEQCCLMVRLTEQELKELVDVPIQSKKFKDLYYLSPADLDMRERPLLLNPLNPPPNRNPRNHLVFGVAGKVVSKDKSPIGTHTIEVFKLDRPTLEKFRQKEQEKIRLIYYSALFEGDDFEARLKEKLKDYRLGSEPYSAAALDYVRVLMEMQRIATKKLLDEDLVGSG
jgi:hypothetical protein